MATRQYIGARYVIKIYQNSQSAGSAEWEADTSYEPLTMVTYQNSSYLSKKAVPATVGNPASNSEYWVVTGAYNGQIAELQNAVTALDSEIEALTNISPLVNYSSYLIVGTNAQYTTISAAYTAAKAYASASNRVAIIILPGTYTEEITDLSANYIDIIGIGSVTWKYASVFPDAPFYIGGSIAVSNIKFINDGANTGSLAIHVEGSSAGSIVFNNCEFTSVSGQAVGVGFVQSRSVRFNNCTFTSWVQEALYFHNCGTANATDQRITLDKCEFVTLSATHPVIIAEDARYRLGTTGTVTNSVLNVGCIDCVGSKNFVQYIEVTGSTISYSLPFIPKSGAPYAKMIALTNTSFGSLLGTSARDYRFTLGSTGKLDGACNFAMPYKNANLYNVTATYVALTGSGGNYDITSTITVTVNDGEVILNSNEATYASRDIYASLTFVLKAPT